ncbi:Sec-independent protein translocase TatB [Curtobacterium sp. AB451]|uniref:twin-arginine translocation protein subunit TatB n=1 Tax=unclassified Curtobacterium TaxID=257496 RepID=UPI00034CF037|nr:twin-arginine translocation protein subunit TatB [Curtobacterium sp. B18]
MDVDKLIVLGIVAAVFLGPHRLVGAAQQLAVFIRRLRRWADATKAQVEEETGVEIDWSELDPRRYDPRRIIRDALTQPPSTPSASEQPDHLSVTPPGGRGPHE